MVISVKNRRCVRLSLSLALVSAIAICAGCSGNPNPTPGVAAPTSPPRTQPPSGALASPSLSPSPSPAAAARTFTIQMTDNLRFEPAEQTVPLGSTVVWVNSSSVQHTSTDDPSKAADKSHAVLPPGAQAWDSGNIDPGKSFQHVFNVPGTYHYFCMPHEAAGMLGTIVVQG